MLLRRDGLRLRGLLDLELLHRRQLVVDRVVLDRRRDLHDVGLQRAQLRGQPARFFAQAVHHRAELVVHRAEPLEQLAGGGRDAVDVVARLLPGLGAQLVGGRLGGLEDLLHAGRRRRRDGLAAAAAQCSRPRRRRGGGGRRRRPARSRGGRSGSRSAGSKGGRWARPDATRLTSRRTAWATKCASSRSRSTVIARLTRPRIGRGSSGELDRPFQPVGLDGPRLGRGVLAHDGVVDDVPARRDRVQRAGHHLQRVLDRVHVEAEQPGREQDRRARGVLDELVAAERQAAAGQGAGELAVGGAGRPRPGAGSSRLSAPATAPPSRSRSCRARSLRPAAP